MTTQMICEATNEMLRMWWCVHSLTFTAVVYVENERIDEDERKISIEWESVSEMCD